MAEACREVLGEELSMATGGFAESNLLGRDRSGTFYQGELQGAPVAVWVPHQREATPWAALKAAADRLASLKAQHVVLPRAVCQDGSIVYNLMQASFRLLCCQGCFWPGRACKVS